MPLRVRYHECDGPGIVSGAHYLTYVDRCSFEAQAPPEAVRKVYATLLGD